MAKGYKTGGRKKGSLNKGTLTMLGLIAQFSFDPIDELIKIVNDEETPIEVRANICLELLPYFYQNLSKEE
jgi:hypothetical protein